MPEEPVPWRWATRLVFRFVFSYLMLYSLYTYDGLLTFLRFMVTGKFSDGFLDPVAHHIVPWAAKYLLHLPKDITVFSNGSGDTTYDWVLVLCELVLALAAAAVWSALDGKRPDYRRLHAWLRLLVRLELASEMLLYGFDKVFYASVRRSDHRQTGSAFRQPDALRAPLGIHGRIQGIHDFQRSGRGARRCAHLDPAIDQPGSADFGLECWSTSSR